MRARVRNCRRSGPHVPRRRRVATLRFFFNGTPEMLLLSQTPQIVAIAQEMARQIAALCSPYERYNMNQLKDEAGTPVAAWIVFVLVMEAGSTEYDYMHAVRWSDLKWIVYDRASNPVKVRTSGEILKPLGRKQCCFRVCRCSPTWRSRINGTVSCKIIIA